MLRAFALYVALMISVVVALICGSLLTLYYLNDKEYYLVETDRRLRNNVESAFNWVRENELKEGVVVKDLFAENRDSVQITTRDWGFLNLVSCKAFSGSRSKTKSALMGQLINDKNYYALYLADYGVPLSLSGEIKIKGDCFVPKGRIDKSFVKALNNEASHITIDGTQNSSGSSLPKIRKEYLDNILKYLNGEKAENDSLVDARVLPLKIFNFNNSQALFIRSNNTILLSDLEYKGKVIIQSAVSVIIKKSAILEDIMIFAPIIVIEDDFNGSGQFFATDSLLTGKECNFLYPSVLAVVNSSFDNKITTLKIGERSKVKGAVLLFKDNQKESQNSFISLSKDTEVYGQIYSERYLELKGVIYGSVICSHFVLNPFTSEVTENLLNNMTIDITQLPKEYVGINFLMEQNRLGIIKFF